MDRHSLLQRVGEVKPERDDTDYDMMFFFISVVGMVLAVGSAVLESYLG